ncbi:MAG: hypothetical protein AB7H66_16270 [Hyphomonadaceae bacterium]
MTRALLIAVFALAGCGMIQPDQAGTQAAVRAYLEDHPETAHAAFFASARVSDVDLCATTTVDGAVAHVCPALFENEHGEQRRAFVTLRQPLLEWTAVSFEPIEE